MIDINDFNGEAGARTSLHKISMQSSAPSCNGVNRESEIDDIMYGVESLCTGTVTAFIETLHNC